MKILKQISFVPLVYSIFASSIWASAAEETSKYFADPSDLKKPMIITKTGDEESVPKGYSFQMGDPLTQSVKSKETAKVYVPSALKKNIAGKQAIKLKPRLIAGRVKNPRLPFDRQTIPLTSRDRFSDKKSNTPPLTFQRKDL